MKTTQDNLKTLRTLLTDAKTKYNLAYALDRYEAAVKQNHYSKYVAASDLMTKQALIDNKNEALSFLNIAIL